MTAAIIDRFEGEHRFLSNFYPVQITVGDGLIYPSVEHAYQALKTTDMAQRKQFANPNLKPGWAKRLGRKIPLRPDWEHQKLPFMEALLREKFARPDLRQALIDTGDAELIEGNWWGDTFWGMHNDKGQNHLGRLLMKIRAEILNT